MLSLVFGLLSCVLGLWGMYVWSGEFLNFLKGFLPISFVFAGIIAMVAGFSALKSRG